MKPLSITNFVFSEVTLFEDCLIFRNFHIAAPAKKVPAKKESSDEDSSDEEEEAKQAAKPPANGKRLIKIRLG